MKLIPYRASDELRELAVLLFKHPFNKYNRIASRYFAANNCLSNDMSVLAIGIVRYYLQYPQQFGGALENIYASILVRMHRQLIKYMLTAADPDLEHYIPLKLSLIKVSTQFFDQLLLDIQHNNYYQSGDDMRVKPVKNEVSGYSDKLLDYYDTL